MKSQGAVDRRSRRHRRPPRELDDCEFEVLLYEFKADLNTYLAGRGPASPVHSLKDLIAFNDREQREREMPYFGQEIFVRRRRRGRSRAGAYRKALTTCSARSRDAGHRRGDDEVTGSTRWSHRPAAPHGRPISSTAITFWARSSTPAAVAGYPSITVPAGFVLACRSASLSSAAPGASRS